MIAYLSYLKWRKNYESLQFSVIIYFAISQKKYTDCSTMNNNPWLISSRGWELKRNLIMIYQQVAGRKKIQILYSHCKQRAKYASEKQEKKEKKRKNIFSRTLNKHFRSPNKLNGGVEERKKKKNTWRRKKKILNLVN